MKREWGGNAVGGAGNGQVLQKTHGKGAGEVDEWAKGITCSNWHRKQRTHNLKMF